MDAPHVSVKLFAALRDAAGTGEVSLPAPTTMAQVCRELAERFGPRFAARLEVAAGMVDGIPTDQESTDEIPPGAEVALLPPFAGG